MYTSSPQVAAFLSEKQKDLRFIYNKLNENRMIAARLIPCLPSHLAPHVHVVNRKYHTVTLLTANGTIATQLRYQASTILKQLHQQHPELQGIRFLECKVSPQLASMPTPGLKKEKSSSALALLSPETADIIRSTASSLSDPKLRAIMERIANHTKKPVE